MGFSLSRLIIACAMLLLLAPAADAVFKLSADDGVTTNQALTILSTDVSFDSILAATAQTSVVWRVTDPNKNKSAVITLSRAVVSGGSAALQNSISIATSNAGGGTLTFTPSAAYSAGVALPAISTIGDNAGAFNSAPSNNEVGRFNVIMRLNAPATAGSGTVTTTLTLVVTQI